MLEYFSTHLHAVWFAIGFILLAVELLLLGFATGFILFLGLAALLTGGLLWFGIVPAIWLNSLATFAILSLLVTAVLWKPFKSLQNNRIVPGKDNTSDFIGYEFRLTHTISITEPGLTRYSGIEWKVEIDNNSGVDKFESGTLVKVTSVDAGKFRVVKA